MELRARNHGWKVLTPHEVEVLKKAISPDEPEVVDELNNAIQTLRNGGNVSLDEKLSVMSSVVKAVVFLMQYTDRNDEVTLEEERFILRNLTNLAGFLIKSLSLNEAIQLIKGSAILIWEFIQQYGPGHAPSAPGSSSSSCVVDPSGPLYYSPGP